MQFTPYRPWSEERKAAARARIAQARRELRWSDAEIARRAKVNRGTISRIEHDDASMPIPNVASAICEAVRVGLLERAVAQCIPRVLLLPPPSASPETSEPPQPQTSLPAVIYLPGPTVPGLRFGNEVVELSLRTDEIEFVGRFHTPLEAQQSANEVFKTPRNARIRFIFKNQRFIGSVSSGLLSTDEWKRARAIVEQKVGGRW